MEIYVDDEAKLTLHGLVQHYIMLNEEEKNRKLNDLLDALDFNQVCGVRRCPLCTFCSDYNLVRKRYVHITFMTHVAAVAHCSMGHDATALVACSINGAVILAWAQVVIFVKSVMRAKELNKLLVECNFPSICIHRGMKQEERCARCNCCGWSITRKSTISAHSRGVHEL